MRRIIKNCIKCNLCGDIIVSEDRHDFKSCKCGAVSVDGGNEYLRRGYKNTPRYLFRTKRDNGEI